MVLVVELLDTKNSLGSLAAPLLTSAMSSSCVENTTEESVVRMRQIFNILCVGLNCGAEQEAGVFICIDH